MTTDVGNLVLIRGYTEKDKPFIKATFLRGLYFGDSWFSRIDKDVFMYNYGPFLDALIEKRKNSIAVACLAEDLDVILGYSIMNSDFSVVDWVYVKTAWRKNGIAKSLLPKTPKYVSHLTNLGFNLLSKINNPIFNPFV